MYLQPVVLQLGEGQTTRVRMPSRLKSLRLLHHSTLGFQCSYRQAQSAPEPDRVPLMQQTDSSRMCSEACSIRCQSWTEHSGNGSCSTMYCFLSGALYGGRIALT